MKTERVCPECGGTGMKGDYINGAFVDYFCQKCHGYGKIQEKAGGAE